MKNGYSLIFKTSDKHRLLNRYFIEKLEGGTRHGMGKCAMLVFLSSSDVRLRAI